VRMAPAKKGPENREEGSPALKKLMLSHRNRSVLRTCKDLVRNVLRSRAPVQEGWARRGRFSVREGLCGSCPGPSPTGPLPSGPGLYGFPRTRLSGNPVNRGQGGSLEK
jgi:hypothetical protein